MRAVCAAALVAAAACGTAAVPVGHRRGAGVLQPAGEATFEANARALHELEAAASRKDALVEVQPAVEQAHHQARTVSPEMLPSASERRVHRELDEAAHELATEEGRRALEAENAFHVQLMDARAAGSVRALMNRLLAFHTHVRLGNPVRGGHSVRYTVAAGSPEAVVSAATEFGIVAAGGELRVPTASGEAAETHSAVRATQHNAGVVAATDTPDIAPESAFPDYVNGDVSRGQALELAANNKHVVSRLGCPMCEKFAALTARLARQDVFIRLYGAIPHGHTADYELVRGARAAVVAVAAELGLRAGGSQITGELTSADDVEATAEETHGFEAATTNEGAGEPIN